MCNLFINITKTKEYKSIQIKGFIKFEFYESLIKMKWIEDNPYKVGVIAFVIVSLGAVFVNYQDNYPAFYFNEVLLWLPAVWCMMFIAPVSCSILNGVKRWDGSAGQ